MSAQGAMINPTLLALLRASVRAAHPAISVEGRSKVEILEDVRAHHGWPAVLAIGAGVRALADHPIAKVFTTAPSADVLVQRWRLLERFSHTRNRIEVVGRPRAREITLRHVAVDGGAIPCVDHLYIWGVLATLLEMIGARDVAASFAADHEARPFHELGLQLPDDTGVATFRWDELTLRTTELAAPSASALSDRLALLLRTDLHGPWSPRRAARALGLSGRSLQRALHAEGTTFSATLLRARVAFAEGLLADPRLSLTDVAFCAGFADQAHFTRTFRRYADVPPSAFRHALRSAVS